jgi:hypothetical protein
MDFVARFSVNLKGGPAMMPQQFAKWKQKNLLGVSLMVVAPTGSYDPTKLVNWGMGLQTGVWLLRTPWPLGAGWLCGYLVLHDQSRFLRSPRPEKPQTEAPIGSFEGHLSYDFSKRRCGPRSVAIFGGEA